VGRWTLIAHHKGKGDVVCYVGHRRLLWFIGSFLSGHGAKPLEVVADSSRNFRLQQSISDNERPNGAPNVAVTGRESPRQSRTPAGQGRSVDWVQY
jgi:hypothetical protein